jgi:hypothetical protein
VVRNVVHPRKRSDEEEYINQNYRAQVHKKSVEDKKTIHTRDKRHHSSCWSSCGSCTYGCCCNSAACANAICNGNECTSWPSACPAGTTTLETPGTLMPTSSYPNIQPINECGGICYPSSVPSGTTLSGCTISFTGLIPNTWYAVAVQVSKLIVILSKLHFSINYLTMLTVCI